MSSPHPGPGLTAAEITMRREALGLEIGEITEHLGTPSAKTWSNWEGGHSRPPATRGLADQITGLEVEQRGHVAELAAWARAHPDQPITIWRWRGHIPADRQPRSAGWWRAVAQRAAAEVPGTRVQYHDPRDQGAAVNTYRTLIETSALPDKATRICGEALGFPARGSGTQGGRLESEITIEATSEEGDRLVAELKEYGYEAWISRVPLR